MRVSRCFPALLLLVAALSPLAACDDATGFGRALVVTDTVTLGAPRVAAVTVPTALDVTTLGGVIVGGRFPERPDDADQWDVALRLSGGQFTLAPRGAIGVDARRAGITESLGQSFDAVREAPSSGRFKTTEGVQLQVGNVYAVRSRTSGQTLGGSCFYYAKVQPVALDAAAGTARLAVATSSTYCGDTRLAGD